MISEMYEKKLRSDLFRLSIFTLLTVGIWIGLETYRAFTKSQVKPEVKREIVPLTPILDLDTMENIKQRQRIKLTDWDSLGSVLVPGVDLNPGKVATDSNELASPEATESSTNL